MKTGLRVVAALSVFMIVASACSPFGNGDSGNDEIENLPPEEIIERAVERWNETETAQFRLEVEGATYLDRDQQIRLTGAEGSLARPLSVEAIAHIAISLVTLDVSLIFIGNQAYMTDFLTGSWGPAPDDFAYNPALLLSETEGLGPVLEQLQEPEVVGRERAGGRDAVRLRGSVSEELLDDLTAGAITGDVIGVDIWFDVETLDVVELQLAEPDEGTTWIIELSDHNEPVSIEAPEV